jgi:predicted RNase H-like HicB family nuclease
MRYSVVLEKAKHNYSAYVPDLPGCVTTGRSVQETMRNIREAIELHIEGLERDGDPIPDPATLVDYVDVSLPQTAKP